MKQHGNPSFRVALLLLSMPFGVAAQKVTTSSQSGFDFGTHRRYAWSANHIVTRQGHQNDAVIEQKIVQSVNRTLAAKGFSESRTAPNFLVSCEAGAASNTDFGAASPPPGTAGTATPLLIPYPGVRDDVWYSVDGTVAFRLTDAKSNQVVWAAVATKKIRDPQKVMNNLDQQVEQVVSKTFKSFPPRP